MAQPKILYIGFVPKSPSLMRKLAGISRYCAARGWEAVPIERGDAKPQALAGVFRRHSPLAGCVVDGVDNNVHLPPRLFRGVPVSYIGYMRGRTGRYPNFHFNTGAIVETAFRELAAGRPSCYAAVGYPCHTRWADQRVAAFRATAAAHGANCLAFPLRHRHGGETWAAFAARLVPWLAALPEHCAIFAVSDSVAVRVAASARTARRHIPRSITLVSVDNFRELCDGADTPVTSIELDFERAGFLAAKALGRFTAPTPILIDPLLVVRRKSTSGRGRHEPWILEAVEIIRREACGGLTASRLLDRFPQSRRNFERRFREAMGHSILDEILGVRLEAATTLLAQTDTAIAAIPDMCGFQTYRALDFHFRSRFKMGLGAWREMHTHT